jgi:RNA-binding protein
LIRAGDGGSRAIHVQSSAYNAAMTQKRIPGRRVRPTRGRGVAQGRPTGSATPFRPKRVRAGSASAKAKRKRAEASAAQAQSSAIRAASAPELSEKQRRHLRGLAHELKPIIRLGNAGLTDAVATETARALEDHELIKVKAPGGGADREARDALFAQLAQRTSSALIHRIGNVAVLYRPHATVPRILIPDAGP